LREKKKKNKTETPIPTPTTEAKPLTDYEINERVNQ